MGPCCAAQAGPGASARFTRIDQVFSAYSFTASGRYLPQPQPYYVAATNGTGILLPAPLFLSLLPTSLSFLAGVSTIMVPKIYQCISERQHLLHAVVPCWSGFLAGFPCWSAVLFGLLSLLVKAEGATAEHSTCRSDCTRSMTCLCRSQTIPQGFAMRGQPSSMPNAMQLFGPLL